MSAIPEAKGATQPSAGLDWLLVLAGLLILYVPTFLKLAAGHWQQEEGAHGPIILAVIAWLIWRDRAALVVPVERNAPAIGFVALVFGLLTYVVGRSQEISLFEIVALVPILVGTLLALRGWPALRAFWFPIFFLIFMVPLPGVFTDALTGPLKQLVSDFAERILHAADYPIGRSGVMLVVGQYQLMVADACSGLNSMFSLSALGLLYMFLIARASVLHNVIMLVSILPIAFAANIVRVIVLILITYHFGDEAGQGFLHGSAGIVLLLAALGFLLVLDGVLGRFLKPRTAQ